MENAVAPPGISQSNQIVTQLKSGITALPSSSRHLLQATPDSSFSTGYGLSVGSVYKIGSNGVRRARGLVVYASIDQGIVVVNPLTQTALASHTFSPSLHPITAPLVIQSSSKQSVFICLAPRNQDSSAEVHIWTRDRTADSPSQDVHHRSEEISSSVRSLHPLTSGEILTHHCDGTFSIIDSSKSDAVQVRSYSAGTTARKATRWTHHISVLDRFASTTILRSTSRTSHIGLIIRFSSSTPLDSPAKRTRSARKSAIDMIDEAEGNSSSSNFQSSGSGDVNLEFFSIEEGKEEDRIKVLSSTNLLQLLHLSDAKEVQEISLYHSGRLALLTTKGHLLVTTVKLASDYTPKLGSITSTSLPLTILSGQSLARPCSFQLITSSMALLIVGRPAEETISAALVELDLACVLAESSWSVKGVETTFIHRAAGSIALVLATRRDETSKIGVTCWTLPYEVSEDSHLRWALASSALSKKWILMEKNESTADEAETGRKHLIKELERIATEKHDEEAGKATDAAFFEWHKEESKRLEAQWLANAEKEEKILAEEGSSDSDTGKRDKIDKSKTFDRKRKSTSGKTPSPAYPHEFVTKLVNYALPTTVTNQIQSEAKGYAKQTIYHLLTHRLISRSTRPDLIFCLLAVDDWDAVLQSLRCVNDLPEDDIVDVLLQLVRQRKNESSNTKKVKSFLTVFASIALNRSQLRTAMKNKIEDVNDVVAIFEVLCAWLDRTQDLLLKDFHLTTDASVNGASKRSHKNDKLPDIDHILTLLCDLMDTYFPLFLSTNSTHEYLQQLSKQINAHLIVYNQLLILRGPLAAFSRLEADQKKEAAAMEIKKRIQAKDSEDQLMNLRKSNKKALQSKGNVIGEVGGGLGKGILGEKSRRRQMYEENVAVGLYSLERLEL